MGREGATALAKGLRELTLLEPRARVERGEVSGLRELSRVPGEASAAIGQVQYHCIICSKNVQHVFWGQIMIQRASDFRRSDVASKGHVKTGRKHGMYRMFRAFGLPHAQKRTPRLRIGCYDALGIQLKSWKTVSAVAYDQGPHRCALLGIVRV